MRKLLFLYPLLLVGLIFGIGLKADYQETSKYQLIQPITVSAASQTTTITPIDGVWAMINQVNQDRILTDLRKLSGAEQICLQQGCYTITNRYIQNEGLQWAVNYVYAELTKLGYSVEIQDWSRSGYTSQNLIVRKPGLVVTGGEIYFVAHMDGVANSPAADDDASGVVSLLELARILRGHLYNNTIVLLFSTGEEVGTLGVRSYLDQLTSDELNAIKYVINVDMIGYDGNNDSVMELLNGSQPIGDLVQPMIDIISAYQLGLIPKIVSDCGWGDEGPFREKGITAAVQIENFKSLGNPYNHTSSDTIAHINTDYLSKQVKATTAFAGQLAIPFALERRIHLPIVWTHKY